MSADSPARAPWPEFKAALDAEGFRPSRRYGQNFLLDENTVRAIVKDSGVGPEDRVLEVGTGCGFLTVHLAAAVGELWTVEVDPRLARVAKPFLDVYENTRLIEGDVLAGKHELAAEVEACLPQSGSWHLVSNLPYSISGPILAILAARPCSPASMTVLVQKEVAERLAAEPGTRAWGPLSLAIQLAYEPKIVRSVGPGSFWPRPRVDSAVIRLDARADAGSREDRARVTLLARKLFERRRQSLGRVLGDTLKNRELAQATLAQMGLDPGIRAETLDLAAWFSLTELVKKDLGPLSVKEGGASAAPEG